MEYHLKNSQFEAVVTTKGGELISFKDLGGQEYIWDGDAKYWSGRNPILFPIVGNLKDGKIQMDGKIFEMNRHGFARDHEFSLVEKKEDRVILELRSSDGTMERYPRQFSLKVIHALTEKGFSTTFMIENQDEKIMPFCIGAHTAFRCPIKEGDRFEDYQLIFDEDETAYHLELNAFGRLKGYADTLMLDHSKQILLSYAPFIELDTIIFKDLKSKGVTLKHKEKNYGVHMDFDGFPMMAFWTPAAKKAPFLCIEPWHGCAAYEDESGKFEDKEACILLNQGECKTLTYEVSILK